jgi:hypothetical protein
MLCERTARIMSQPSPGVNLTRLDPGWVLAARITSATDSTPPVIDQPTMGENLLITCQRVVRDGGAVNSPKLSGGGPSSDSSGDAEASNRIINKFSPSGQGTLCPVKLFGIIELFERCRGCPRRRARSTMNAVIKVALSF